MAPEGEARPRAHEREGRLTEEVGQPLEERRGKWIRAVDFSEPQLRAGQHAAHLRRFSGIPGQKRWFSPARRGQLGANHARTERALHTRSDVHIFSVGALSPAFTWCRQLSDRVPARAPNPTRASLSPHPRVPHSDSPPSSRSSAGISPPLHPLATHPINLKHRSPRHERLLLHPSNDSAAEIPSARTSRLGIGFGR